MVHEDIVVRIWSEGECVPVVATLRLGGEVVNLPVILSTACSVTHYGQYYGNSKK